MKHIPRNLNLPPFWRLLVSVEMVQSIPTRALSRARDLSMLTHLTAVDPWARLPAAVRKRGPRFFLELACRKEKRTRVRDGNLA